MSMPAAAAIKISDSANSIRVRIGTALLMISGEALEMLDIDAVASEIRDLDDENAICTLLGFGFEQLGNRSRRRK